LLKPSDAAILQAKNGSFELDAVDVPFINGKETDPKVI
jgi:hypothetical protein